MTRALPLHQMVPGASFEGTMLVDEALRPSEVVQCIKEAIKPTKDSVGAVLDFMYLVPGHPPMRPEPGFIDFVSFLSTSSSFQLSFRPPDANLGITGSAGGTVLQEQPGSATEGPSPGISKSRPGRLGQEDEGSCEEEGDTEAASSRWRRGDKQ